MTHDQLLDKIHELYPMYDYHKPLQFNVYLTQHDLSELNTSVISSNDCLAFSVNQPQWNVNLIVSDNFKIQLINYDK